MCKGEAQILPRREGIYPDKQDKSGRTPLSYAARDGHTEVVAMLLRREDVNPITIDI